MTRTPQEQLLAELGLSADALVEVAAAPPPVGKVAHGLSGSLPPAKDYSESFQELRFASQQGTFPFQPFHQTLEPAILRIEEAPAPCALVGTAEVTPEGVRLDGRAGREGGCAFETPEGLFLVTFDAAGVKVFRSAVPPASPTVWTPVSVELDTSPPTLAELLGDLACEAWLVERFALLSASPAMVERASAVGLVARLWSPSSRAERTDILTGHKPHPSDQATAWLRTLGESRKVLGELAVHRAASLREALDALPRLREDPSDDDLMALLYERDVLESVRVLLAFVGEGRALGRELVLTDDVALTVCSAFAPSRRLRDDPLLRAVFVSEPDAFWGQLVGT